MMTPLDIDTLKALVGEASISPKAAAEMLDETGASASDCESPDARVAWGVLEMRIRAGQPIDAIDLAARTGLSREVALDLVMDGRATLGVARQRLALLRESSLRRQYLEALRCVARVVTDKSQPLANAVTEAGKLLASWTDDAEALKPLDEALLPFIDELEEVSAGRKATTIPAGIDTLDSVIGGLQPTLTVIGALPGVGKSALAAAICRNLAGRGLTTGLLSLEDERGWLVRRLMAEAASVPVFVLANKPLGRNQQERVLDAAQPLQHLLRRILVDDRAGLSTAEVVASARRMVARGAKAILVDHLGEIRLQRTDRHDLDIADALRDLRTLAKSHRVPVVVFTHLRRRDGLMQVTAEPKLTDFAFSAGIERMARVALGLYRSDDEGELRAAVLKQTQGVSGVTVSMRLNTMAGVVTHSPATTAQRNLYATTEDDS